MVSARSRPRVDDDTMRFRPLAKGICKLNQMPWMQHLPKCNPELEKTLDANRKHWESLAESVSNRGSKRAKKEAVSGTSKRSREEAAAQLLKNHEAVLRDLTLPTGSGSGLVQAKQTQPELQRLPIKYAHHADEMMLETCRRLLDIQSIPTRLPSKAASQAWQDAAAFLRSRIQTEHMEDYKRGPDMSVAAGEALKAVLTEVQLEAAAM